MKTRLLSSQAAWQLIAVLLFLFIMVPLMAQVQNEPDVWDGTDTWQETFKDDLTNKQPNSEWNASWVWTNGNLPQLKKEGSNDLLNGQTEYSVSNYLQQLLWSDKAAEFIENEGDNNGLSADNPILIKDAAELAYFAKQVNAGANINLTDATGSESISPSGTGFSGYHFALSDNIDLKGWEWTPIGTSDNRFRGHFDGNGHVVEGLKIEITGSTEHIYAGLFGYVSVGEIRNLGVRLAEEGIKVETSRDAYVGGIVGDTHQTTIRNCYVDAEEGGKITVKAMIGTIGGIAGGLDGTITHCYSTVDIEGEFEGTDLITYSQIGGIVGGKTGTISYTYATGSVIVEGNNSFGDYNLWVGGICGYNSEGSIQNNLALNKELSGKTNKGECYIYRMVSKNEANANNNYASPKTTISSEPASAPPTNSENGTDTWLDTFKDDLLKAPGGDGWSNDDGWKWPTDPSSTLLPKLAVFKEGQPEIDAKDYLSQRATLHIVQPKGGTLTVSLDAPNAPALNDGDLVVVGSTLKLLYTSATTGYNLDHYLYGTSATQIDRKISGDTHEMPNQDIWISASVTEPEPEPKPEPEPEPVYPPPTPIYYTVTLPQVEGATTDPGAGHYEVESWNTFRFYLTLDSAYSDSQPVVTTSRGETLTPRQSDGAYLVKYVRSDVEIRIDSIRPNLPPVANEAIASPANQPRIWTEASTLCIGMPPTAPASTPVYVLTADGRLWRTLSAAPGLNRQTLPRGFYIIRVDDVTRKVIVR